MDKFNEYYNYLMETLLAGGYIFGNNIGYGDTGGAVGNTDSYNTGSFVIPKGGKLYRRNAKMDITNKKHRKSKKKS